MEAPEVHVPHHHVASGHRWVDLAIAASAILISLVSLVVAIGHGKVMEQLVAENHRQVQASTWPFLQLDLQTTSRGEGGGGGTTPASVVATISNHGNGPARIQTLEVGVDGKPVTSLGRLLGACCRTTDRRDARFNSGVGAVAGSVLAQRETTTILSLAPANPAATAMTEALIAASPRITLRACYCSVFDECWYARNGAPPQPVKACPVQAESFHG